MSVFNNNRITMKGAVAIAAIISGKKMPFTRIAVGDGEIPLGQNPMTMTDLANRLFDVDIHEIYYDSESQVTIKGTFSNKDTETGFFYRELGLFATDPVTGEEILFCYGNAGADAEWISPAGQESVIEKEVHIVTLVGNAENVSATIKSGLYPTNEQVKTWLAEKYDKTGGPISGDVDISGTLDVNGKVTVNKGLGVTGGTITDTINITGNATVGGTLTAKGKVTASGGLVVTGGTQTDSITVNGASTFNGKVSANGGLAVEGGMTVDVLTSEAVVSNMLRSALDVSRGTAPKALQEAVWNVFDKDGTNVATDRLMRMLYRLDTSNVASLNIAINNPANATAEDAAGLVLQWSGGKPRIALTHHPEKASNDHSVASTNWVKSQIATQTEYGFVRLAQEPELLVPANVEAAINPAMLYDIEDFRKTATTYKVGDKVKCPFNFELFLECTTAGTTCGDPIDMRNVKHDQKINDGTVVWTVRTHIRSINGTVPDATGNVSVVTTILKRW